MKNVPRDVGGCVDRTLCPYEGYFIKLGCILCKCHKCGTSKFLAEILDDNADKCEDNRKHFLVKLWYTKSEEENRWYFTKFSSLEV